jgi:hypothetical protein
VPLDALELVRINLLSPVVLAFVLGAVATWVRSDLRIPDEIHAALSIYLLLAIGLKGGAALAETPFAELWRPGLATLALGLATPLWCYALLRRALGFGVEDAAALAAHYGSVSAVTFVASVSFVDAAGAKPEGMMPTLLALLEVPGIAVALLIARTRARDPLPLGEALRDIVAGRSILLLLGGLVIGALGGRRGLDAVAPFFVAPFQGVLCLFLLELGMTAARRLRDVRRVGVPLLGFGVLVPLLHGVLGAALGRLSGLSLGGSAVLGTMAASASYIAAPAAVRLALPAANPALYLTAALGITFPFNLAIGIPLYFAIAQRLFP